MIVISGSNSYLLAKSIAKKLSLICIKADVKRFEDQELCVHINESLYEKDVVIVQSTSKPANDHLMELLLLVDTARRAGARRIIAVIPYFGYSRQDRSSSDAHAPISASLVATLLEAAGVNRVITLDLHSKRTEGFFKIGVKNLDILELFTPLFKNLKNQIIISPDVGGVTRAQKFSEYFSCELAVINKHRKSSGECIMTEVIGDVRNKDCIIIDDIIDSANTICKAAELLMDKGALSVTACVTHAVLSKNAIKLVEDSSIGKLYVTDSIAHSELSSKINIIPISNLLAFSLKMH